MQQHRLRAPIFGERSAPLEHFVLRVNGIGVLT
jgi:hypothetical protein